MAFRAGKYHVVISDALMDELREVVQRPRLKRRIDPDPRDPPVLSTAMDGKVDAIVTGADDLRADDELRSAMADHGIQLWGVQSLLEAVENG